VIRVLLADDQALVRAGLRMLIDGEADIEVAGEACDGEQAVALALETPADVVLMDISMPALTGVEATRRIVADERISELKVIILTTFETDENIFDALRAGASGFLLKDSDPVEVLYAIRVVAGGHALLAPSVTRRLIADFTARPKTARTSPQALRRLTEREREVMALVAAGLSNDDIAERLVISRATAKTHVSRAMRKLGAHDRAQLVVLAYETGLMITSPASASAV
jgi:DNA-binding NarL/FixJ family response regulator